MHATKSFSTGEGGVIYSADPQRLRTLRAMSNFGFGEPREATMMGLNGKMSEVAALLACLRLETFEKVVQTRCDLVELYRALLPELTFQPMRYHRQAHQLTSSLLPRYLANQRTQMQGELRRIGVDTATYFSPHVAEHSHFADDATLARLPVTNDIASRALTLPLFDTMTEEQVRNVCSAVRCCLYRKVA